MKVHIYPFTLGGCFFSALEGRFIADNPALGHDVGDGTRELLIGGCVDLIYVGVVGQIALLPRIQVRCRLG